MPRKTISMWLAETIRHMPSDGAEHEHEELGRVLPVGDARDARRARRRSTRNDEQQASHVDRERVEDQHAGEDRRRRLGRLAGEVLPRRGQPEGGRRAGDASARTGCLSTAARASAPAGARRSSRTAPSPAGTPAATARAYPAACFRRSRRSSRLSVSSSCARAGEPLGSVARLAAAVVCTSSIHVARLVDRRD